jgi:ribonuclease VapC
MIFVDASAFVAVLAREEDGLEYAKAMDGPEQKITSSIAVFEAALAICRKLSTTIEVAEASVRQLIAEAEINVVGIGDEDATVALAAHERYGKGRGHPAQLNMGDCFVYAVAKVHRASVLYKGNDFVHTDIQDAMTR